MRGEFNLILASPCNCFDDVMTTVRSGLIRAGCTPQNGTAIVFGFYTNPKVAPQKSIIYQLEPYHVNPRVFPVELLRRHTVWDYSRYNIEMLRELGIPAVYVPMGYSPELSDVPSLPQDIDVLFIGSNSPRRTAIFHQIRKTGLKLVTSDSAWGETRRNLIARAKMVLNLHSDGGSHTFESVRVGYLLANKKVVITESNPGDDLDGFEGVVEAVPYNCISETCAQLVQDTERCQGLAAAGFDRMVRRDEVDIITAALEETDGRD